MMIRAIIVDDVENARVALKSDVEDYCDDVEIVGEADGVATGLALIEELKPDVVFLDIKMGDGSGFDLLEQVKNQSFQDFQIIFTTAYDEYALKAFKYNALDYLLKPIDHEELEAAVEKAQKQATPLSEYPGGLSSLLENIKSITSHEVKRLALNSTERIHIIDIKDIVRCEASGNYTYFYLSSGQKLIVTKTMKEYNSLLEKHDFIRVHHSHLVNMAYVKEFVKLDGTYLVMSDGAEVPVSVRKKEALMNKLNQL